MASTVRHPGRIRSEPKIPSYYKSVARHCELSVEVTYQKDSRKATVVTDTLNTISISEGWSHENTLWYLNSELVYRIRSVMITNGYESPVSFYLASTQAKKRKSKQSPQQQGSQLEMHFQLVQCFLPSQLHLLSQFSLDSCLLRPACCSTGLHDVNCT